jgi:hypothetical protein
MSNKTQLDCIKRRLHHWCRSRWATGHDLRLDRGLRIHGTDCLGDGRDVLAMASLWRPILVGSYAGATASVSADVLCHWMVYVGWSVVIENLFCPVADTSTRNYRYGCSQ